MEEALVGAVASGFEKKLVGLKDTLDHLLTGPGGLLMSSVWATA